MVTSHPFASWVSSLDIALWNLTEQYAATRVKSHRRQCRHIQWGQLNSIYYYSLPDITYHVAIKTIERIIRLGLRVSNNVTMIICYPLCVYQFHLTEILLQEIISLNILNLHDG